MLNIEKVRQQLFKSVHEKYLKQLPLLIFSDELSPSSNIPLISKQASSTQTLLLPTSSGANIPTQSSGKSPVHAKSISTQLSCSNAIATQLISNARIGSIPKQISQQEQLSSAPKEISALFQINGLPFQIPRDVALIIAEQVGQVGMENAAFANHAFYNLKCAFFAQKKIVPTEEMINNFLAKKQKELESLQSQYIALFIEISTKKKSSKSSKDTKSELSHELLPTIKSLEMALCWLLIQISHISMMTTNIEILRKIAFVFHSAYLCLQQLSDQIGNKFSFSEEEDFAIHTIGLRSELAAILVWKLDIGYRTGRQCRLLNHWGDLFALLTNPAVREAIATEVLEILKNFKSNPYFGINLPVNNNCIITQNNLKEYKKMMDQYSEKWTKHLKDSKTEHTKQMKAESSSPNCSHSNRGLTHTINEMLPSVLRR